MRAEGKKVLFSITQEYLRAKGEDDQEKRQAWGDITLWKCQAYGKMQSPGAIQFCPWLSSSTWTLQSGYINICSTLMREGQMVGHGSELYLNCICKFDFGAEQEYWPKRHGGENEDAARNEWKGACQREVAVKLEDLADVKVKTWKRFI